MGIKDIKVSDEIHEKILPLLKYIEKLEYDRTTTVGLWATDKVDAIPEDKKHLFFRIDN